MADLVRRNSGGLVTSDAGPGKDPSSIDFSSNPLQQWWGIEDVPQHIINQFHQKSLFPTQLILDEMAAPEIEGSRIVVRGWIVGTHSFTDFKISKRESESENAWQVSGKVFKFKNEADVRKSFVAVDVVETVSEKPNVSNHGQEERLGSAHTLPAQLRRMLLSVSSPTFFYSTIWLLEPDFPAQPGSFMRYQVPSVVMNSTTLVAIHAQQRVDFSGGESKKMANKLMSSTSWEAKVVRAFL